MISADRMKSVRMAPLTIDFSVPSPCAATGVVVCSLACPLTSSQIFSAPS